jgi:hypothetical protein
MNFLVVIFRERKRETAIFINTLLGDSIIETSTWTLVTTVSEEIYTYIFGVEARQIGMRDYRNGRPSHN